MLNVVYLSSIVLLRSKRRLPMNFNEWSSTNNKVVSSKLRKTSLVQRVEQYLLMAEIKRLIRREKSNPRRYATFLGVLTPKPPAATISSVLNENDGERRGQFAKRCRRHPSAPAPRKSHALLVTQGFSPSRDNISTNTDPGNPLASTRLPPARVMP